MKAAPQKRRSKPRYPTKVEVQQDPELLRRHLPATWAVRPKLATAAALLLSLVALPRSEAEPASLPTKTWTSATKGQMGDPAAAGSDDGLHYSVVLGMPSPPVYLTEDEAWRVINDELTKAKISLPERMVPLDGMKVSRRTLSYKNEGNRITKNIADRPGTATQFKADRGNLKRRLALEFVSLKRYEEEGGPTTDDGSRYLDFRGVAESLSAKAAAESKASVFFGVLYDPASDSRPESKRLLRLQVQDFIKWLQTQGAI